MSFVKRVWQLALNISSFQASSVFMLLGIFTLSWERFGNVALGGYNLKISVLLFAISLILSLIDSWRQEQSLRVPIAVVLACGLVALFSIMGLVSRSLISAQMQTISVLTGAIIPFFAVLLNLKLYGKFLRALNSLIYGAIFACFFGIYQLVAFYLKIPQIVSYTATDVNGLGRISGFSYESGYFGYFVVLAMVAVLARGVMTHQPNNQLLLGFLGVTLVLANSRATFVTIPILILCFLLFWPRPIRRPKVGWLSIVVIISSFATATVKPDLVSAIGVRFFSLFDPNEVSSNAPRLEVLSSSWEIFVNNSIWGIGPSSLKFYLYEYGYPVNMSASPNAIVANNSLFQALLDGGLILFLAQLAFVIAVVFIYFTRSKPTAWVLLCGWLTVLFVSGFITSYYWDIKLWVVLALAIGAYYLVPTVNDYGFDRRPRDAYKISRF